MEWNPNFKKTVRWSRWWELAQSFMKNMLLFRCKTAQKLSENFFGIKKMKWSCLNYIKSFQSDPLCALELVWHFQKISWTCPHACLNATDDENPTPLMKRLACQRGDQHGPSLLFAAAPTGAGSVSPGRSWVVITALLRRKMLSRWDQTTHTRRFQGNR